MDIKTKQRQKFIVNTAYIALVITLVVLGVRYLVPWLLPFIMGYIIAVLFKPAVRFLSRRGLNPKLAGLVVVILAYALIGLLLTWGGVRLVVLIGRLFSELPVFFENTLEPAITAVGDFFDDAFGALLPQTAGSPNEVLTLTLEDLRSALLTLSATALNFLGTLGAMIPRLILTFFFTILSSLIISMNYRQVSSFLSRQIPEKHRELFFKIKTDTLKTVGNYFIAYLKIMGITFAELAIGLSILGVANAPLIALGIAIFDAFPVLGTGGIMIPWVVIEFIRMDYPLAVGLLVLYAIITVVRGFIEPRIVGSQLGLHPLVTLCAIYAGFVLMGLIGMILFPITAQILVGLHRSGIITLWRGADTHPPS